MRPALSFRSILLLAAATFLLPAGGLVAYLAYAASGDAMTEAYKDSTDLARAVAVRYESFLHDNERMLRTLAQRPAVRAMDPTRCDPLLPQIHAALPVFTSIALMPGDFSIICSTLPAPGGQAVSLAQEPAMAGARGHHGLHVSEPFVGPISGRRIFIISYPVLADDGRIAGRIATGVDLERWQGLLAGQAPLAPTTTTILSREGRLLARWPVLTGLLGESVAGTEISRAAASRDTGAITAAGIDGVRRVYGFTTVTRSGWHVYVGRPEAQVLAPAHERTARNAIGVLTALSLMGLFVLLLYYWLQRTVATLGAVTQSLGGNRAAVPESGPRELREAIATFNGVNTIRRDAEDALRERETRLRGVERIAHVGGWEVRDPQGPITWTDETWRIYGRDPGTYRPDGASFAELVHPEDRAKVRASIEACWAGEAASELEFRAVWPDGTVRFLSGRGELRRDAAGRPAGMVGTVQDITERKRAEAELHQTERKYRWLYESMTDAFALVDMTGRVLASNPVFQQMMGYTDQELRQLTGPELTPAAWHEREALVLERVLQEGYSGIYEKEFRRKDGSAIPVEIRISLVRQEAGLPAAMTLVARDISERKRIELELRSAAGRMQFLARRLVEVQDAEQRRISRELHDVLGQNLAALGINLKLIRARLRADATGEMARALDGSQQLLERSIAFTRGLISELRPPALDDYGLLAGLRWYGREFEAATGLAIVVEGEELVPRLARAAEVALFRIAQEALANTIKHARAGSASLRLSGEGKRVVLTIADDGAGFEPAHAGRGNGSAHWGLLMMRERAEAVGATLRTESAPGQGTRVVVELARAA